MSRSRLTALLCPLALLLASSSPARAWERAGDAPPAQLPPQATGGAADELATPPAVDPTPDLRWDPAWPRFSTAEYLVTGLAFSAGLAASIVGPRGDHWQGGILADEATRDALRLEDRSTIWFARDLSDVLLTVMMSYPFVVDALIVTGWGHRSPDVAKQTALINMQAIGVTLALQSLAKVIASRERPYGRTCGLELPESNRDCDSNSRHESFFSGHTALSFTAAGLICSHHAHLELYGGGWADVIPCAAGLSVASGVGLLRIMGDNHYLSDVLVGAAVGTLTGLGLPWLLHYRHRAAADKEGRDAQLSIQVVPLAAGAGVVGTF